MHTQADKSKENKNQSVAGTVSQKQNGTSTFQFIDNRPESVAQRKLQEMADRAQNSAPVQMKLKVAGGATYNREEEISEMVDDASVIKGLLEHPDTYLVKTSGDIRKLANDEEIDILSPNKHIVGENHDDSKFGEITASWPGVPKMGEGNYMVHETDLTLGKKQDDSGKKTLEENMNSRGADTLPLENFHTAAQARLVAYLVIVNSHQYEKSETSNRYIKARARDILNAIWAYLNVGVSAFMRGNDDATFGGVFGGKFERKIEELYADMYDFLQKDEENKAARETIDGLVQDTINPDELSTKQLTQIRNLIKGLIPKISAILKESTKAQETKNSMIAETTKIDKFVGDQGNALRGKDMQRALNTVNPARETYMKKQIGTLGKPGLVKVGRAHLAGLKTLDVPDATYYDDYNDFYSGIKKRKGDL